MPLRRITRVIFSWTGALLLAGLAYSGGLLWYATDIPTQVTDTTTVTDAIVVLTGGSERLDTGLGLLRQKMGRKLFVSGVYRGVDVAELLRLSRQKPEEVECCIVLGHAADHGRDGRAAGHGGEQHLGPTQGLKGGGRITATSARMRPISASTSPSRAGS